MNARLWLAAIMVAGCSWLQPFTVDNPQGLTTRMSPAEVQAIVLEHIASIERAAGHVVRPPRLLRAQVLRPDARGFPPDMGPIWEVEAEGTFISELPAAQGAPMSPTPTGHFMIRDADGSILSFGSP